MAGLHAEEAEAARDQKLHHAGVYCGAWLFFKARRVKTWRGLLPTRRGDVVVVACVTCYSYVQVGRVTHTYHVGEV